jgi:hypothetical protein
MEKVGLIILNMTDQSFLLFPSLLVNLSSTQVVTV